MKSPLVSVLICTYNAEKTIENTLNSCLKQTYENIEILILDNCSKDKTKDIIKEYMGNYKNIRLYDEWKNLWAYNWLNYLIDKANGKYIAIQDHDDIWHPEKIEEQIKFLENNKTYVWCGTWTLVYYVKSKVWYLHSMKESRSDFVMHTSLVFRNDWFKYDTTDDFLCDSFFMKNILSKNKQNLFIINKPLSLHLIKENWGNYSEQWFSITKKCAKRYFQVYWINFYFLFIFAYLCFCRILPRKIRSKLDFFLTKIVKWAKSKQKLEQTNEYCKEMLMYF